jgi:hypothetical protein
MYDRSLKFSGVFFFTLYMNYSSLIILFIPSFNMFIRIMITILVLISSGCSNKQGIKYVLRMLSHLIPLFRLWNTIHLLLQQMMVHDGSKIVDISNLFTSWCMTFIGNGISIKAKVAKKEEKFLFEYFMLSTIKWH